MINKISETQFSLSAVLPIEIVEIGRGASGKVYKAELADTGLVALKSSVDEYSSIEEDELNKIDDEFFKELELLREVKYHQNINCILGITKVSKSYILVLEYANEGDLRDYLKKKFTSLQWKDKTQMALDIACGLKFLHLKDIIHRDLHSKNILVNNGKLLIADLGLSKKLAEATTNSLANTKGMVEYTEPQCFKFDRYKKNKKSDIYSLGVLLWEISSGHRPFPSHSQITLAFHISFNNLRENPIDNTPQKYQQLYQECWNGEPNSRPDIENVYETLSQLKTEDFSSLPSSQSNINEIKNSNIDYNDDLNISDYLNSRRESSHEPNFKEEALKRFDNCKFGKSGNAIVDEFILKNNLKWIPFDKFKNVEYLTKGGFSTTYKAIWLTKSGDIEVVLKCNKLDENLDNFLNEWKYHASCLNSSEIINLYGFTKDPDTLNYMATVDYANKGNLSEYLTKIIEYNWKQKLYMLYQIISGLSEIHKQNIIHCDFHDGNILIHKDKKDKDDKEDERDNVYISDFGLCRPVKSFMKKHDVYGVLSFMAPEVLRGNSFTQASDIYSFSMIMWEFTSGIPPFNNRANDIQLSLKICKGERPEFIENTPQCYIDLMKKCWNEDPLKRPSALEIKNIIGNWIFYSSDKINDELLNNIMEFINAPIGHNNLATEYHSQSCYTSRLLNFDSTTEFTYCKVYNEVGILVDKPIPSTKLNDFMINYLESLDENTSKKIE
ncbi:unnamed protein product [Rhizophagus irregularis]|nr:unnamed protein product [Rhizophagus irregularis]